MVKWLLYIVLIVGQRESLTEFITVGEFREPMQETRSQTTYVIPENQELAKILVQGIMDQQWSGWKAIFEISEVPQQAIQQVAPCP